MSDEYPAAQCKRCQGLISESQVRRATSADHLYCSNEHHVVNTGDTFCGYCYRLINLRGAVAQLQYSLYHLESYALDDSENEAEFAVDNALGFIEFAFPQYEVHHADERAVRP